MKLIMVAGMLLSALVGEIEEGRVRVGESEKQQVGGEGTAGLADNMPLLWSEARSRIATVHLKYKVRPWVPGDSRVITYAEYEKALKESLSPEAKDPEAFVEQLVKKLGKPKDSLPWGKCELTLAGNRVRSTSDGSTLVVTENGKVKVHGHSKGGIQIDLGEPANGMVAMVPGADEINWIPSQGELDKEGVEILEGNRAKGRWRTRIGQYEMLYELVFDRETGDVFSATQVVGEGIPVFMISQRNFVEGQDGVRYPSLRLTARFNGGKLAMIKFSLVESAEFNQPMDESRFWVPVGKGDVIIDHRVGDAAPFTAGEAVPDVFLLNPRQ